jgi:hypothetical protein
MLILHSKQKTHLYNIIANFNVSYLHNILMYLNYWAVYICAAGEFRQKKFWLESGVYCQIALWLGMEIGQQAYIYW